MARSEQGELVSLTNLVGDYFNHLAASWLGGKRLGQRDRNGDLELQTRHLNSGVEVKASSNSGVFILKRDQLEWHNSISEFPYDQYIYILFRYYAVRSYRTKMGVRKEYLLLKSNSKRSSRSFLQRNLLEVYLLDLPMVNRLAEQGAIYERGGEEFIYVRVSHLRRLEKEVGSLGNRLVLSNPKGQKADLPVSFIMADQSLATRLTTRLAWHYSRKA